MVCVSPPEPDDTSLWAYLDGEADLAVRAHMQQCPHCRQRAARLAAYEGRLAAGLYRAACPTPHELGEYHLGLLPAAQATTVAQHLGGCPHCTREVARLEAYLEPAPAIEPARAPGPLAQVREQVRVVVAQLLGAGQAPALAGVRGEDQASSHYQTDGVEVVIGVQPDAEQPEHSAIMGLVIGLESTEVVAHLWQNERPIATASVDELDSFVLPNIAPGTYELILAGPKLEIVIQDLKIGTRGKSQRRDV
jgi:hypothetical protein